MEFVREYFDETDNKYVLEYSVTEEEKKKIDDYCKQNDITIDQMVENFLQKAIEKPDEFARWIKDVRDDKFPKGTIGKPKCKRGDTVGFYIKPYGEDKERFFIGTVEIIDAYGTFEQDEEPSYDIMVDDFNGVQTLVKHVRESECYDVKTE